MSAEFSARTLNFIAVSFLKWLREVEFKRYEREVKCMEMEAMVSRDRVFSEVKSSLCGVDLKKYCSSGKI